jgi:beta-N-acetylhexosaminidase
MKKPLMVVSGILIVAVAVGTFVWLSWYKEKPVADTPKAPAPAVVKPYVDEVFDKMTLKEKVASLFIFHASGTNPSTLKAFMDQYKAGGFILMGDNIPSSDMGLKEITSALKGVDSRLPRLVAVDEEGGSVKRLPGDNFPSAETLKNEYPTNTSDAFIKRSELVASVGINLNFGIIADVTDNPHSFIYDRVLGTTPQAASNNVRAAVGATRGRTLSTLKHFPGHGETTGDSHVSIPTTNVSYDSWKTKDMLPFEAGIESGADLIMFGHLRYSIVDSQPASLSKKWHDILRDDLKFKGVAITDDMLMLQASNEAAFTDPVTNAIMAINAGNDLLLYVLDNQGAISTKIDPASLIDGVVAAANDGRISKSLIDADVKQVLKLRNSTEAITKNQ